MTGKRLFFSICIACGIVGGWWWSSGAPLPNDSWVDSERAQAWLEAPNAPANVRVRTDPAVDRLSAPMVLSYHDGIMKAAPSVVSVYVSHADATSSELTQRSLASQGSGVIVDDDGIILTNQHLIEEAEQITVVLNDGTSYPGLLIGSDAETDLAVVRIPADNLPFIALDDAPALRVGDVVLAIGNPFGVGQTVTQGIVSATQRRIKARNVWQYVVQIDAAINPGNSGGALINPYGQLVGVTTAVLGNDYDGEGIGYAIPADLLTQVVPEIIEFGSVSRGWLGTQLSDLISTDPNGQIVTALGALVTAVIPDSPASEAGIQVRDIVIGMNDEPINSANELLLAISIEPPGTAVTLSLLRQRNQSDRIDAETQFERIEIGLTLGNRVEGIDSANPR